MIILRTTPPLPFGRKVRIAAAVLGLERDITVEVADTNDPADTVRRQNPLGKIPVLIAEDGRAYYDSRVILDYLDHRAGGGRIVPRDQAARVEAERLQALGDGILDAAILQIYESRFRAAEKHERKWLDHQADKVKRGLGHLEAAPPALAGTPQVGHIAIACALGYLDLRFAGAWRADHPRLVAWLDGFAAQVPAFAATRIEA